MEELRRARGAEARACGPPRGCSRYLGPRPRGPRPPHLSTGSGGPASPPHSPSFSLSIRTFFRATISSVWVSRARSAGGTSVTDSKPARILTPRPGLFLKSGGSLPPSLWQLQSGDTWAPQTRAPVACSSGLGTGSPVGTSALRVGVQITLCCYHVLTAREALHVGKRTLVSCKDGSPEQ